MATHDEDARVHQIIETTLRRRASGDQITDEEVLSEHPELAVKLSEKLKQLRIVANARKQAAEPVEDTIDLEDDGSHSANDDGQLLPGQRIKHYVLVDQIGRGGFGTVWRAHDTKLACDVAVKIPSRGSLTTDTIDRFIREARMSAQLRQHPHIVSVHEADWDDKTAFIVCDFIEGVSLSTRLAQARISLDECVDLLIQICGALHHAHEARIIHRDLKPDNILLDTAGQPHVTDFGLAMQEQADVLNEAGQTLGTVPYMSPEQAKGDSNRADRRSDVFALGIIFYEMLVGERPFRGSVVRVLQQICNEDPTAPRSFDAKIPTDLQTICLKCLEKSPGNRYQSADEVADELQRYQRHEPILARPVSAAGRLWRWCKRNPSIPWLSLALLLVTLASTLIGTYLLNQEVASMQSKVEENSRETLDLAATFAADDAGLKLDNRFRQVRRLANNKILKDKLRAWNNAIESRPDLISQINSSNSPMQLHTLQDLIKEIASAPSHSADKVAPSRESKTFSWFICDKHGYQIARHPPKETMGTKFDYRSYFTGDLEDRPRSEPGQLVWGENSTQPKLSGSFLTLKGDTWVLAISVPIQDGGNFEGVVGIFIELTHFVNIPGLREPNTRLMAIYDARLGVEKARPIRHSYFINSDGRKLNPSTTVDLSPLLKKGIFTDPFLGNDWRAVAKPIDPTDEDLSRLYVVIQEKVEIATSPGEKLGANLIVLGLSVLALGTALLLPVWFAILRKVQ